MDSSRCRARIQEASRSYTALTLALDHALWSYSKPQGARTTSRCGSKRLGIVSIYPCRAHTAEEPVGGGPRRRCYGHVNPGSVEHYQGGKGVNKQRTPKIKVPVELNASVQDASHQTSDVVYHRHCPARRPKKVSVTCTSHNTPAEETRRKKAHQRVRREGGLLSAGVLLSYCAWSSHWKLIVPWLADSSWQSGQPCT